MKIAVTGSSGFVGEHVVRALRARGHEVLGLGRQKNHENDDFKFLDLDNTDNFEFKTLSTLDVLIHLAWGNLQDFRSSTHVDIEMQKHVNFFKNAESHLPRHVIGLGTCLEYGMQSGCLEESATAMPTLAYAKAKHQLHSVLQEQLNRKSISLSWLRLFYVYGLNKRRKTLYTIMAEAASRGDTSFRMSSGKQVRDFISVEDCAETISQIVKIPHNGVLNLGSGKPQTVREFVEAQIIKNNWKLIPDYGELSVPDYEPMEFWANRTKLDKTLSEID